MYVLLCVAYCWLLKRWVDCGVMREEEEEKRSGGRSVGEVVGWLVGGRTEKSEESKRVRESVASENDC